VSRAITELQNRLKTKLDTPKSLADKLGIARGTLMAILAKQTEPRLDVIRAAKKNLGIEPEAWT
jgi:transcriptional regulator with XRE-family HTH domain